MNDGEYDSRVRKLRERFRKIKERAMAAVGREEKILTMWLKGKTSKEVADAVGLTDDGVKSAIRRIYAAYEDCGLPPPRRGKMWVNQQRQKS